MSTFSTGPVRKDNRTILLNAQRTFSSGSAGLTGSITLGARPSSARRDLGNYTSTSRFSDLTPASTIDGITAMMSSSVAAGSTDITSLAELYLSQARSLSREDQAATLRVSPKFYVFDPAAGDDVTESEYSQRKYARRYISGSLVSYYATENQGKYVAAGNYFSLSFHTSSQVPSGSAIIFPDFVPASPFDTTSYAVTNGLTIDVHANPRFTTDAPRENFRAGVIVQVPGSYCLALATGSHLGPDGRPDRFRLILMLSHSSDISPSLVNLTAANGTRSFPQDLVFVSDDNSLVKNAWHHISVSWSSVVNSGTGSFYVDGEESGTFSLSSGSISRTTLPGCLVVGNQLQPSVLGERFFNAAAASSEGLMSSPTYSAGDPSPVFASPLNAEIHSLKVYNRHLVSAERDRNGLQDAPLPEPGLIFYLPPYFMHESPLRSVPISAAAKQTKRTSTILNTDLMFGCGGRDINLENFARDLTRFERPNQYPRLFNMTASIEGLDSYSGNFNERFYRLPSNVRRNLTVLPCDDGLFRLNYSSIASLTGSVTSSFASYTGGLDYSLVRLTGMTDEFFADRPIQAGTTRTDPTGDQTGFLYVHYEDQEECTNFGTLIDVPSITYGTSIRPGSFSVTDAALTGSDGRIRITLKDDGKNGLYRADCETPHAYWNTQGLFFENEGLGLVTAPTVPFFAKHQWNCSFDTNNSVHVFSVDVVVPSGYANKSQNPTYRSFPPSASPDETAASFVYIDTINLHDENLNVVARATLSQPVLKRPQDAFTFRLKMDY